MLKLLIVDDEVPLLNHLKSYFVSFPGEFEIQTATSGESGLELFQQFDPDILLTDIRLPGMDGINLIQRTLKLRPELKVIVMTAYSSPEIHGLAMHHGALRFLEKPLDLDDLHQMLSDVGRAASGWQGQVGGLDIFDLAQIMILGRKTTLIKVMDGNNSGVLVFENGQLIHASSKEGAGQEAFYRMARWGGGSFKELPRGMARRFPANIDVPTNYLLMEAARLRDEEEEKTRLLTSADLPRDSEPGVKHPEKPDRAVDPELVLNILPLDEELETAGETAVTAKTSDGLPDGAPPVAAAQDPEFSVKESEMSTLKELLEDFVKVEGISTAVLVSWDGFVIEGAARQSSTTTEAVGAVISTGIGSSQVIGRELKIGEMQLGMIEFEGGTVVIRSLGSEAILAVVAENSANLGNIRYQLKKRAPDIEKALK